MQLIYVTIQNILEVIDLDTQQIIGYLITSLWTLVNIGVLVAIVVLFIFLYKYLHKSYKTQKEADAAPFGISPK